MSRIAVFLMPDTIWEWLGTGEILLIILAPLVLLTPYLLGPLLIRLTLKHKASFQVKSFDPDESPPPDGSNEFFEDSAEVLRSCGFEIADHLLVSDVMEGMIIVFAVFKNQAANDAAMAAVFLGTINGTSVRQRYVEFSSELIDGTEISTNNSKEDGAPVPLPWKRTVQLDTERDAEELYHLHQRAVDAWATTAKRSVDGVTDWSEEIRRGMLREFDGFVEAGYYYLDESGDCYRPTWKGAFLMTWQQLWPMVALRRIGRRRRAEALRDQESPYARR